MATNNKTDLTKAGTKVKKKKKRSWVPWAVGGGLLVAGAVTTALILSSNQPKKKSGGSNSSGSGSSGSGSKPKPKTGGTSSGGSSKPKSTSKWKGNRFPLRKWSNGSRVKALQRALVRAHGNVLPRYGADGFWGDELQSALLSVNWPTYYSEATYSQKVGSSTNGSPAQGGSSSGGGGGQGAISNFHDEAWNLHQAGKNRDWTKANSILSRMRSVGDYLAIRTSFITWPFRGTANYTPLNAMLWAFPSRRSEVEAHFLRMGLRKKSNGKWTTNPLGNLPARPRMVRSLKETMIWSSDDIGLRIPEGMALGREVRSKAGLTEFINGNGDRFFVHTADITFG